jgi:hypothetical protein
MTVRFWGTFFDDLYARALRGEDINLEELGELIENTTAPTKAGLPSMMFARLGNVRTAPPANCLRHDANVLAFSGLLAEHDSGQMPFAEMVDRMETAAIAFIAYTTPSHTLAMPRWRIGCPFSREYPPAEFGRFMNQLNGILGGALAEESWKPSQAYYYGHVVGVPFDIHIGAAEQSLDEGDFEGIALSFRAAPKSAGKGAAPDFAAMDLAELLDVVESGEHFWRPSKHFAEKCAEQRVSENDAVANLTAAFDAVPQAKRGKKWAPGYKSIPKWVKAAYAKVAKRKGRRFAAVVDFVENHADWQGALRLNEFTGVTEVPEVFPPKPGQQFTTYRALRRPIPWKR